MSDSVSAATVSPWEQRRYNDPLTDPACLTDLAVAQLRAEGKTNISQQDVDQRTRQIIDDHNRKVAESALGPDAIDDHGKPNVQAVDAKVAELGQTQQWLTVDGHKVRVIPNHRGDGSLGSNGWDAQKDGWDLTYDGETIFVTNRTAPGSSNTASGPGNGANGANNANTTALPPNAVADPNFVPNRQQLMTYARTKCWGTDISGKFDALCAKYGEKDVWILIKQNNFSNLTHAQQIYALDAALKLDRGSQRVLKLISSDAFKSLGDGNAPRRASQDAVGAQDLILRRYADPDLAFAMDTAMSQEKFRALGNASKQGTVLCFMAMYAGRPDAGYGKLPPGSSRRHALALLSDKVLMDPSFLGLVDSPSNQANIDKAHGKIDAFVKANY